MDLRRAEGKIRLEKLRRAMEEANLSLLAITDSFHNKWLVGTPFVICTVASLNGLPLVFHHPTEYDQVKDYVWLDHEVEIANLLDKDLVSKLWKGKIKISSWIDIVQRKVLKKFHIKASTNQTVVWNARSIKTERELERIKQSSNICKEIVKEALRHVNPGSTGKDIRAKVTNFGLELINNVREKMEPLYPHAHPIGFYHEFNVTSGEETAFPHAETTDRKIHEKEPIALSCAVKFDEYLSEFGITKFLGEPNDEVEKLSRITKEALSAAIDRCKIGTAAYLVDKAAREILDSYGLWNFCSAPTGHSMGLGNQELPSLWPPIKNFLSEKPLEKDQVFSIEPGLWIPPKYGFQWKAMIRIAEKTQILADPVQTI